METNGVNLSISAARTPSSAKITVNRRARAGSFLKVGMKNLKNGMTSSFEIACRSLGAPTRVCKAAPLVEKKEPTKTKYSSI